MSNSLNASCDLCCTKEMFFFLQQTSKSKTCQLVANQHDIKKNKVSIVYFLIKKDECQYSFVLNLD